MSDTTERMKNLLADYDHGCGYKRGDILRPRVGSGAGTFEVKDSMVVVLERNPLAPHQYLVLGERENPRSPSDRFIKFDVNGHDWEKV